MAAISKITFPTNMTASDLEFIELLPSLVADKVYVGSGVFPGLSDINDSVIDTDILSGFLDNSTDPIGELAEKPGKMDSKTSKLKSRNYSIPGKRTSTVELNLVGLADKQKNFLESSAFQGQELTLFIVSEDLHRVVVLNGLRWTVDWSAEADGLFNVVISTEFSGITANKIFLRDVPDRAAAG